MPARFALAVAGFRRWSAYRAAAVAGAVTNSVFGLLRAAITALRSGRPAAPSPATTRWTSRRARG